MDTYSKIVFITSLIKIGIIKNKNLTNSKNINFKRNNYHTNHTNKINEYLDDTENFSDSKEDDSISFCRKHFIINK